MTIILYSDIARLYANDLLTPPLQQKRPNPTLWSIKKLAVARREQWVQVTICSWADVATAAIRCGSMKVEDDMSSLTMDYPAPSGIGINWRAVDFLARDRQQSRLLHEPQWIVSNTDPMTGRDVDAALAGRPQIVDQRLTLYFESEQTRQAFLDMPVSRSVPLPDNPSEDGEAEG